MNESRSPKRRIAILGGGVASITAAFALTDSPEAREQLELTVYQMGWRLGGKGASGRNAAHGQRIEEHGLHVWLGWYHNAFDLLRRCYEELERPPGSPLATIEQAFTPHDNVGVAHAAGSHGRSFWMLHFPRSTPSLPGPEPITVRAKLQILVGLLTHHLQDSLLAPIEPAQPRERSRLRGLRPSLAFGLGQRARRLLLTELLEQLERLLARNSATLLAPGFERLRARIVAGLAHHAEDETELEGLLMLLDFALACARGLVLDRALLFGLDVLDDWDLREWLARHGARQSTLDAPFIKAWYDLAFAYEQGDTRRPNFAAGAALRAIFNTQGSYAGSIFWKMNGGMGDVVFAPLYEVLRRRGVRFEFFHRVEELETETLATPGGDRQQVARVRMNIQARSKAGAYDPLVEVEGLPCWPSEPLLEQLVEGEQLVGVDLECPWSPWPGVGERVLERGRDFDELIFGISLGAIPQLCPGLLQRDEAWRRMCEQVGTVATQAAQLWMKPELRELGWKHPSPIIDAYDDPFNTWADMSFLLSSERWDPDEAPGSLAYLVGPLHERHPPPAFGDAATADFQAEQVEGVRARLGRWLDRSGPGLWPATASPGARPRFDRGVLHDPQQRPPAERLDAQYLRANVAGSERYVQSLRGSTRHRLFVESCGVAGMYPVGDWLNTGINSGDVEAATITGLQAARAILGHSKRIFGEGDGWPRHQIERELDAGHHPCTRIESR